MSTETEMQQQRHSSAITAEDDRPDSSESDVPQEDLHTSMLATRLRAWLECVALAFLLILPHKKEIEGRNIYFESTFVTIVIRRRTTMMLDAMMMAEVTVRVVQQLRVLQHNEQQQRAQQNRQRRQWERRDPEEKEVMTMKMMRMNELGG